MGFGILADNGPATGRVPGPATGEPGTGSQYCVTHGEALLGSRLLGLPGRLALAAWLLATFSFQQHLGARPLRLDTTRCVVRGRLLGSPVWPARPTLRSNLFFTRRGSPPCLYLPALLRCEPGRDPSSHVRAAPVQPLLLW